MDRMTLIINLCIALIVIIGIIVFFRKYTNFFNKNGDFAKFIESLKGSKDKKQTDDDNQTNNK